MKKLISITIILFTTFSFSQAIVRNGVVYASGSGGTIDTSNLVDTLTVQNIYGEKSFKDNNLNAGRYLNLRGNFISLAYNTYLPNLGANQNFYSSRIVTNFDTVNWLRFQRLSDGTNWTTYFQFSHSGNFTAQGIVNALGGNSTNWNNAFGWGDWSAGVDKTYVDALNIDSNTLNGLSSSSFLRSDISDSKNGDLTFVNSISTNQIKLRDLVFTNTAITASEKRLGVIRAKTDRGATTSKGGMFEFVTRTPDATTFTFPFNIRYDRIEGTVPYYGDINFTPYLTISSTDMQSAINELKDEVDGISGGEVISVAGKTGAVTLIESDITDLSHTIDTQLTQTEVGTFATSEGFIKSANVTGLESLDEGNGIGWRLKGNDALNYGNIGFNAIDLSYSTSSSTTNGSTGSASFASGVNNVAFGAYSFVTGISNTSSGQGSSSFGTGSIADGEYTFAIGASNTSTGYSSFSSGISSIANGNNSFVTGLSNTTESYAQTSLGVYSTNTTGSHLAIVQTDRLFVVGNGTSNTLRSNALVILKNGTITAPSLTSSLINTAGNTSIITKGYADANYSGGGGSVLQTTSTVLDLSSTLGNLVSMSSANTSVTYTITGEVANGYAQVLINSATEPTVTSATKTSGATWVASTNMYMIVWNNGNRNEYYFLEI